MPKSAISDPDYWVALEMYVQEGLSIRDISNRIGRSHSTIGYWLKHDPSRQKKKTGPKKNKWNNSD